MSSSRNPVISISRVLGMLFIILCHIIGYYTFIPGSSFLGQFFIAGVQLFIFISGYLYGGKAISKFAKWYARRALTISVPAILLAIIVMVILAITNHGLSAATIAAYCVDAEGLLFISGHLTSVFKSIPSLDPLWFTTVIMLCYLLIPLLQKLPFSASSKSILPISAFFVVGIGICLALYPWVNFTYFFFFIVGYILGKFRFLDTIGLKFILIYTALFIAALVGRIVLNRYADGTSIYAAYTEFARFITGTWFVTLIAYIHRKTPKPIDAIAGWKIIQWFDSSSFYIYLTHGIFCLGVFNVYIHLSLPLATLAFFAGSLVSAILLKWICSFLTAPLSSRLKAK